MSRPRCRDRRRTSLPQAVAEDGELVFLVDRVVFGKRAPDCGETRSTRKNEGVTDCASRMHRATLGAQVETVADGERHGIEDAGQLSAVEVVGTEFDRFRVT